MYVLARLSGFLKTFRYAGGLAAMLVFSAAVPGLVSAQGLNMTGGTNGEPLTVDAEDGIEWRQNEQVFIATGNARAVRGDLTIRADELRAYYREAAGGNTDVWRMDGAGRVVMTSPGETATGEHAVYDVGRSILVLKPGTGGPPARLVSGGEEITATGQLEFWDTRDIAVARGNARATQGDRTLYADVLVAHLVAGADGSERVDRIEAFDAVKIVTSEDTVTSDRGTYQVESGIATLVGSVKMQRGQNTLEGCRAVVDTRAGVSRLFSCKGAGDAGGRVKGQIVPKSAE